MTVMALFQDQTQDSFRSHHVLFLLELSPIHGTLYALSQVDFVRISDDTRIHVLHIGPGVCLHVPTRTLGILASESISLGLLRRHQPGLRYERVALSLMTSEPLFSFSTHRRTLLARTTCPISFTTRCSSLSSVRPTHIDRNVRGVPFSTTRTPPSFRSDGIKHSTMANNGRIGDLYGLPVRRSNEVAPPLCG